MAINRQLGTSSRPLAGLTAKVTTKKDHQLAYNRRCGVPSLETMRAKSSELQPQTAIAFAPVDQPLYRARARLEGGAVRIYMYIRRRIPRALLSSLCSSFSHLKFGELVHCTSSYTAKYK